MNAALNFSIYVTLSGLSLTSWAAWAEPTTASLHGVAIQAAAGYQQQTVNVTGLGINNTSYRLPDRHYNTTAVPTYLGLSYTRGLTDIVTLGAIAEYNPVSNQIALSVVPGLQMRTGALGYLKIGWVYSPTNVDQGPGRSSTPGYLNGTLIGIGVKIPYTPNIFGYAEANYIKFANMPFGSWAGHLAVRGNAAVEATNLMIGVGYRF